MLVTIPANRVVSATTSGAGTPTIVLPKNLSYLRRLSAARTGAGTLGGTFFVYEPAGSGASGPGPLPRTTSRIVTDLQEALASTGLGPPYIAAGYSATAFAALMFAYRNKQHTRGLILIDPSTPFMNRNINQMSPMLRENEEEGRRHLVEALAEAKEDREHGDGSDEKQIERVAKLECQLSEWDNLHTGSSEEIAAILRESLALDAVPTLVFSAGIFDVEDDCKDEVRKKWHADHSACGPFSIRQVIVKGRASYPIQL